MKLVETAIKLALYGDDEALEAVRMARARCESRAGAAMPVQDIWELPPAAVASLAALLRIVEDRLEATWELTEEEQMERAVAAWLRRFDGEALLREAATLGVQVVEEGLGDACAYVVRWRGLDGCGPTPCDAVRDLLETVEVAG